VRFNPFPENVEVPAEVFNKEPPVIVSPFVDSRPAAERPPPKVDVADVEA
jgi:hypothetical protein